MPGYGLYLSDLEFRNQFDIKSITEHIVTVSSVMLQGGIRRSLMSVSSQIFLK